MITFEVRGIPAPGGSKKAFTYRQKSTGKMRAAVVDACARTKPWQALVSAAAAAAYKGPPLEGPLRLEIQFRLPRPKAHYVAYGIRHGAPDYHIVKPDATKLLRSTEDALKGICWRDDSQVAVQLVVKRYAAIPGAVITVMEIPPLLWAHKGEQHEKEE